MIKRVAVLLMVAGLLASAKTYTFSVDSVTQIGTARLKPGEYRAKVDGTQALLVDRAGRQIETTAKVESADHKFMSPAITVETKGGGPRILEVELGGTTSRVVFESFDIHLELNSSAASGEIADAAYIRGQPEAQAREDRLIARGSVQSPSYRVANANLGRHRSDAPGRFCPQFLPAPEG